MNKPLEAIDFLNRSSLPEVPPVCVVFGDEPFFKREVLVALRRHVLGDDDGAFSLTLVAGSDAELRDVRDELSTVSMFGNTRRVVLIEDADDFVTRHRGPLEDFVTKSRAKGVLMLDVKTWASNTRLFKVVAEHGLQIQCKQPAPAKLSKFLIRRAKQHHQVDLVADAAETLLELIGSDAGLLDQELARVALLAGADRIITQQLVSEHVGNWRTRTTWDLIDAATDGDAAQAMQQLDRLLLAGENPIALLGQIASTLRRFARATRIVQQAERAGRQAALAPVLERAGFKRFVLHKAERQLRQLGRERGGRLYRWLLEADLAMKGSSSSPARARIMLETLIVRLSKAADRRRLGASRNPA